MEGYRQGMTLKALLEDPNLLNPLINEDKESGTKDGKLADDVHAAHSALLMPNLWEKTLPFDGTDFTLEFMDLDEFLDENYDPDKKALAPNPGGQPPSLPPPGGQLPSLPPPGGQPPSLPPLVEMPKQSPAAIQKGILMPQEVKALTPQGLLSPSSNSPKVEVEYPLSQTDIALSTIPGEDTYDPRKRTFSEDELRPQPMIKKSKKVFVPDQEKDDRYWQRREKNNVAAKRSRDARRIKENQIALRASFLEKENETLKDELKKALENNKQLTQRLAQYEDK